MDSCRCLVCFDKGWIETSVFDSLKIPNGIIVIEKCDLCNYFTTDTEAAKFVFHSESILSISLNGFNVKANFSFN
jgi:selenocysteine-specific translation elongation factor